MSIVSDYLICSGNLVPTKRGIALTEQQWDSFLSHRLDIDKLLDLVKSDNKKELPEETQEKELFLFICYKQWNIMLVWEPVLAYFDKLNILKHKLKKNKIK